MKWHETVASHCRWSEIAESLWGDWEFLWEKSEDDYQGSVEFLAQKGNKYVFFEYSYGSCSGCDYWEDMPLWQIKKEWKKTALHMNLNELKKWEASLPEGVEYPNERKYGIKKALAAAEGR